MKAKLWQETKSLSAEELAVKLRETEEQLFRLRFRHASTPLKNALEIRTLRRMVARYKTLIKGQAQTSAKSK